MIDTVTGKERNLKNIRQIGTPSEEDKIYIENTAYQRIHAEEYASRRAFIFMGHTECDQGYYTTFIEAAIPVRDLEFSQNVPKWDNHTWSDIFQEIKRSYEDSIIVGWALDIKGFVPRMSLELEEAHREHFGGAHQMLLLMDSLEGEEYFYINKGNRLQKRDGFYIYYCPKSKGKQAEVTVEIPQPAHRRGSARNEELPRRPEPRESESAQEQRSLYRAMQQTPQKGPKASNYAMTAAVLLLVGIVGIGVYQDRIQLPELEDVIATVSSGLKQGGSDAEVLVGTEPGEKTDDTQSTETVTDVLNLVPVQEVPSGEIRKSDGKTEGTGQSAESQPQGTEQSAENQPQGAGQEQKPEESGQGQQAEGTGQEQPDGNKAEEDTGKSAQTGAEMNANQSGENAAAGGEADSSKEDGSSDKGEASAAQTDAVPEAYYTVKQGDTLTAISTEFYGTPDYIDQIVEKNHLEDSNDIRVGQKLLLP